MRFTGKEISNLDAISLSNCPKLSDNPRIKTVEYTVESTISTYLHKCGSEKTFTENVCFKEFQKDSKVVGLSQEK